MRFLLSLAIGFIIGAYGAEKDWSCVKIIIACGIGALILNVLYEFIVF